MKYIIVLFFIFSSFSFALNEEENNEREKKHIEEQIKKEQKYSREQTFYKGENYDLKSAEVDENSVKSIPDVENRNEDFDMNSVYD